MRQGHAADRAVFARRLWRLWRLSQDAQPSAALLLVPDRVRLRQAQRMLDTLPLLAFLALEREAAHAKVNSRIWAPPPGTTALDLEEILEWLPAGGELPDVSLVGNCASPLDLPSLPSSEENHPSHLLPAVLKPTEKRALDLLADWPWLAPQNLGQLLGVSRSRLYQVLSGIRVAGLTRTVEADGQRCLALTDRELALLARRDRTSVGTARKRWSVMPVREGEGLTWRNVSGSRSRQLLRHLEHTRAVHGFLAALSVQARRDGWEVLQLDPPRRAVRFFQHGSRLHSVRPDAFGILKRAGSGFPFFLEWERRAVRPGTMTARLSPYLRYYATHRPLDDHGAAPAVLVVFDDALAATHFLDLAERRTRETGVKIPLLVSCRAALDKLGPLGPAWQRPGRWLPSAPLA